MLKPLLIKNVKLYAPEYVGKKDLLVLGDKIEAVADTLDVKLPELEIVDGDGAIAAPGIIDQHNHFGGAGGEGGFNFRTPPVQLSTFVKAGITTAVGLLGTDGYSRSLAELLAKARALEQEGLSTYMYTGCYQVPGPNLTGRVGTDIAWIDKIIGCKMALSDHRSSHPTVDTIRALVSEVRVAGMLAGKRGVVCVHMGCEEPGLAPLREALLNTDVPLTQFMPTHVQRCEPLLKDAARWVKEGGVADITTNERTPEALSEFIKIGADLTHVCFSSDGNGSMPRFDAAGNFIGMGVGDPVSILRDIAQCAADKVAPLDTLFACAGANPAHWLGLNSKGHLKQGYDADIMLLDEHLHLQTLIAKGQIMLQNGKVLVKGTFE